MLAVLGRIEGVQLYSLQKGTSAEQVADFARRFPLIDLGGGLNDFADTAGVMPSLDLVITCDSALAHLAGALGLPVWVPMSAMSDWRWLRDRAATPWYPTMRLFRQQTLGDWRLIFDQLCQEVKALRSGKYLDSGPM